MTDEALLCRYWATGIVRRALGLPCGGSIHSVEATVGHIAEVAARPDTLCGMRVLVDPNLSGHPGVVVRIEDTAYDDVPGWKANR